MYGYTPSEIHFLQKIKSIAIIDKAKRQKNIPYMFYSLFTNPGSLIIAGSILGIIATIEIYYALGILVIISMIILSLTVFNRVSFLQHINNYNYKWFWRRNKFKLTSNILNDNDRINILDQFLKKLDNNNWYIYLRYVQMYYEYNDDNIDPKSGKELTLVLAFRYKEDMIQCKLII